MVTVSGRYLAACSFRCFGQRTRIMASRISPKHFRIP